MLSQQQPLVNAPRTGGWVALYQDGSVFRWRRNDGRQTRTSTTAFLTEAEATAAAATIAACHGVRFVSWNSQGAN